MHCTHSLKTHPMKRNGFLLRQTIDGANVYQILLLSPETWTSLVREAKAPKHTGRRAPFENTVVWCGIGGRGSTQTPHQKTKSNVTKNLPYSNFHMHSAAHQNRPWGIALLRGVWKWICEHLLFGFFFSFWIIIDLHVGVFSWYGWTTSNSSVFKIRGKMEKLKRFKQVRISAEQPCRPLHHVWIPVFSPSLVNTTVFRETSSAGSHVAFFWNFLSSNFYEVSYTLVMFYIPWDLPGFGTCSGKVLHKWSSVILCVVGKVCVEVQTVVGVWKHLNSHPRSRIRL